MTGDKTLAARTVTGVIAGMVAATAIATAVGFWLSYAGLHDFALRAGLHGPEAWAWPASVDLFILAGEAGVTISALRRAEDWQAWAYLAIGFAASVTANVLHVDPSGLHRIRYAVAAVPPVAAMLALAALLRQVYRLAAEPIPVTGQKTAQLGQRAGFRVGVTDAWLTRSRSLPVARHCRGPLRCAVASPCISSSTRPPLTGC